MRLEIVDFPIMIKPYALRRGSKVAVVSPCLSGRKLYPDRYRRAIDALKRVFGLAFVEFPSARMTNEELYRNPKARAEDINRAFSEPDIEAVFCSLGGDDSVRILEFLDIELIRAHPKVIMGYSDPTTFLSYLASRELVTFYGPNIVSGLADFEQFPRRFVDQFHAMLFDGVSQLRLEPFPVWTEAFPPEASGKNGGAGGRDDATGRSVGSDSGGSDSGGTGSAGFQKNREGFRWLQGQGLRRGRLWGGCIEVLEFLKGTRYWPNADFWRDRVLFLETSEEKPTPRQVGYMLRNYGTQGAFTQLSGLLLARPKGYSDAEKRELERIALAVVKNEFGRSEMPVIANLDFGHTDPKLLLPLGCRLEIDCRAQRLELVEAAVRTR
jgi:muramoyltetrapeptide carboxypeptidase LdcA involved in peptidoglycan recycling